MTPQDMLEKALRRMSEHTPLIEARRRWYDGQHPVNFGSDGWLKTYEPRVRNIIDNECKLVVNERSRPLLPQTFTPRLADTASTALGQWVTTRVHEESAHLLDGIRKAKWSGVRVPVFVDYTTAGEIGLFPLDPARAYVEVDLGGGVLWLAWIWHDLDGFFQATVVTTTEKTWFTSNAKLGWPTAGEYTIKETTPNPIGRVPAVVLDDDGSIIDEIWPVNSLLNTSLQTQHVVSETAATPFRVWWGLQVFNPDTGQVEGPKPNLNPATGAHDVTIPTLADQNGDAGRRVEQLESRSPQEWIAIQDSHRLAICRLGSIPAFMAQVGSQALSGDALEIAYLPFVTAATEDQRAYKGRLNDLAEIMVALRIVQLTGRAPAAPLAFDTTFSTISTSTKTSRYQQFSLAVAAGMSIYDAAIDCLGCSAAEAQEIADRAEEVAAKAAQSAGDAFLAGTEVA